MFLIGHSKKNAAKYYIESIMSSCAAVSHELWFPLWTHMFVLFVLENTNVFIKAAPSTNLIWKLLHSISNMAWH